MGLERIDADNDNVLTCDEIIPASPAASNVRAREHPGGGADRDVSLQFETVFQNALDLQTLNL